MRTRFGRQDGFEYFVLVTLVLLFVYTIYQGWLRPLFMAPEDRRRPLNANPIRANRIASVALLLLLAFLYFLSLHYNLL